MKKYFEIDGNDKIYTEAEFRKLSDSYKGNLCSCMGEYKNREEARAARMHKLFGDN